MAVNMYFRVDKNGIDEKLALMKADLANFNEPLRNSATYIEGAIGRRFRAAPWQGLAPSTIKRHPHRAGGKPLNDTGALRMSVTSGAKKDISSNILRYGFGSGIVYAAAHNFGYKQIPQRQFLYLEPQDEQRIQQIFEDYIDEVVNNL
jgi:phage gpG-like protein